MYIRARTGPPQPAFRATGSFFDVLLLIHFSAHSGVVGILREFHGPQYTSTRRKEAVFRHWHRRPGSAGQARPEGPRPQAHARGIALLAASGQVDRARRCRETAFAAKKLSG